MNSKKKENMEDMFIVYFEMLSPHLPTGMCESHEKLSRQIKIRYSPDASISNAVEHSPSLEADSSSTNQEIPQDPATWPYPKPLMT